MISARRLEQIRKAADSGSATVGLPAKEVAELVSVYNPGVVSTSAAGLIAEAAFMLGGYSTCLRLALDALQKAGWPPGCDFDSSNDELTEMFESWVAKVRRGS